MGKRGRICAAGRTHCGLRRRRNEDAVLLMSWETSVLMGSASPVVAGEIAGASLVVAAVFDGCGGHSSGDLASKTAAESLAGYQWGVVRWAHAGREELEATLRSALEALHAVVKVRARGGLTTGTVLAIQGRRWFAAHVGDSRLYELRSGRLRQVTRDHSFTSGVLLQALGQAGGALEVDAYSGVLGGEDRLLLCTDGLSGVVRADALQRVLAGCGVSDACESLVDLAVEGGGPDNVSVVVAEAS